MIDSQHKRPRLCTGDAPIAQARTLVLRATLAALALLRIARLDRIVGISPAANTSPATGAGGVRAGVIHSRMVLRSVQCAQGTGVGGRTRAHGPSRPRAAS